MFQLDDQILQFVSIAQNFWYFYFIGPISVCIVSWVYRANFCSLLLLLLLLFWLSVQFSKQEKN